MENNNLNYRKYVWFVLPVFGFVLLIIAFIIWKNTMQTSDNTPPDTVFPTPVPLIYKSAEVESINPPFTQALVSGKNASFTVTFNNSVYNKGINILLQSKRLGANDETATSVPLTQEIKSRGSQIVITTENPIESLTEYSLIITDTQGKTLLSATYSSTVSLPSPEAVNNQELKKFLPYETSMYKLIYNEQQNIYVFHFKIDSNSSEDLLSQFNRAKAQAEEFIKSKGIDINTIVIEWRHS